MITCQISHRNKLYGWWVQLVHRFFQSVGQSYLNPRFFLPPFYSSPHPRRKATWLAAVSSTSPSLVGTSLTSSSSCSERGSPASLRSSLWRRQRSSRRSSATSVQTWPKNSTSTTPSLTSGSRRTTASMPSRRRSVLWVGHIYLVSSFFHLLHTLYCVLIELFYCFCFIYWIIYWIIYLLN